MNDQILPVTTGHHGQFPEPEIPVEEAWAQMRELLEAGGGTAGHQANTRSFAGKLIRGASAGLTLAAAIVCFWLLARSLFNRAPQQQDPAMNLFVTEDSTAKEELPGGVLLYLDRQSCVREESGRAEKPVLFVNGGVYVENLQATEQVLTINSGALTIWPRQASMYVSFDSSSSKAAMHVFSGSALAAIGKDTFMVWAGESVSYDGKRLGHKQKAAVNLSSYATRIFDFSDTPLGEAAALLEKAYDTHIVLAGDQLAGCRITSHFEHQSLEAVLDIMARTLHFDYTFDEQNNKVVLNGEGCH